MKKSEKEKYIIYGVHKKLGTKYRCYGRWYSKYWLETCKRPILFEKKGAQEAIDELNKNGTGTVKFFIKEYNQNKEG